MLHKTTKFKFKRIERNTQLKYNKLKYYNKIFIKQYFCLIKTMDVINCQNFLNKNFNYRKEEKCFFMKEPRTERLNFY